MNTVHFKAG